MCLRAWIRDALAREGKLAGSAPDFATVFFLEASFASHASHRTLFISQTSPSRALDAAPILLTSIKKQVVHC